MLVRNCNVATPKIVAPIWAQHANCCHKSEQHKLQKVCTSMAHGLAATELQTPVITTTLKQMVVGFLFT